MPVLIQKGPKPIVPAVITAEGIRDALLSLPDSVRVFIVSDPSAGEHKILGIRRNANGNLEYEYEAEVQP